MITGKKHVYCGRVNWKNVSACPVCRLWGTQPKEAYQYVDVVFDNPKIEELAARCETMAQKLNMHVSLSFDSEHENEHGEQVGCLIINRWLTLYPEKINKTGLGQELIQIDGWAIDVSVYNSGSSVEPPSEDYSRVGVFEHWLTALCEAFEMIFKNDLNNIAEGIQFEEQANESIEEL